MKISNPETQALFDALARNTREMIVVPNSWLPEEYHNNRDGGRSLQELSDMATVKMETETQHQKLKREKLFVTITEREVHLIELLFNVLL